MAPLTRIDGNPWTADGGAAFSLGYWLGVYYGFIGRIKINDLA